MYSRLLRFLGLLATVVFTAAFVAACGDDDEPAGADLDEGAVATADQTSESTPPADDLTDSLGDEPTEAATAEPAGASGAVCATLSAEEVSSITGVEMQPTEVVFADGIPGCDWDDGAHNSVWVRIVEYPSEADALADFENKLETVLSYPIEVDGHRAFWNGLSWVHSLSGEYIVQVGVSLTRLPILLPDERQLEERQEIATQLSSSVLANM